MKKTVLAIFIFSVSLCIGGTLYAQQTFTNSIGMEFVLVPAGSFMMGTESPNCPNDDPFTEKNEYIHCMGDILPEETPKHKVEISRYFYMGKYEVTQEQWHKVMGNNPSHFRTEKAGEYSPNHPVEKVSWEDVQNFISKLNQMEKTDAYRLPTEAEWEYAACAGTTTAYSFGDDKSRLGEYAWYEDNSGKKTHPVGQLKPNAWGIYDMHGNVWEWCGDWYSDKYYSNSPSTDPNGPSSGSYRVYRGGGWGASAGYCRSAPRLSYSPGRWRQPRVPACSPAGQQIRLAGWQ